MTDDTKALVERLRDAIDDREYIACGITVPHTLCAEAAATIERLERELALAHDIERSDGEVRRALDAKLAELERELAQARRVPREPTQEMVDAIGGTLQTDVSRRVTWRAMYDAAMKGASDE